MVFHLALITRVLIMHLSVSFVLNVFGLEYFIPNTSCLGDKVVLERTLEDTLFSCGSNFKDVKPLSYPGDSPQTKSLFERVFVRENLN